MRQQLEDFDESQLTRTEAIIRSMTIQERRQPKVLNGSRRVRIARGSGTTVTEVNALVNQFDQTAKMIRTVAKGGVPQVPGMGPMPPGAFGGGRAPKQQQKKKSKSGNPAKRAAENAALAVGATTPGTGAGFGLGGGQQGAPSEEELASLQKFLGR